MYPNYGGGYPQQQGQTGGYPMPQPQIGFNVNQPGFPSQPGGMPYPQQQPYPSGGGYPPQQSYAQAGYPSQGGGGYPPQQQGGYPPQPTGAYPQLQPQPQPQHQPGGYPGGGYPQPGGQYPAQQGVPYGPGQGMYGGSAPGFGPPPGGAYPQQGSYGGQPIGGGGGGAPMNYMPPSQTQGTLRPFPGFNPHSDCEVLKKAMKGFGCDDKAVMNILCFRSNQQRQQIKSTFKTMYGKDIVKELISELRGNLEDVIVWMMYTPGEFDAVELRNAMEGAGTKESVLIEIMCSRTNAQIHAIKEDYRRLFGRDLERDLSNETSYHFRRLLVSLSVGGRDESNRIDQARAQQDAQKLYSAGERSLGTDESTFNAILASQNFAQLQLVFQGLGTNDRMLKRIVITRCEIDMAQIKQQFQQMYGKTLESFISDDISGNYKNAMLNLVRG